MLGQGCPANRLKPLLLRPFWGRERRRLALWGRVVLLVGAVTAALLVCALSYASSPAAPACPASDAVPIRLNISWTSNEPVKWHGEIFASDGFFANPVPLGKDPGASVTFFTSDDGKKILFSDPDSSAYCGVQVTAVISENGTIGVSFQGTKGLENFSRSLFLSDLEKGAVRIPLCGEGHDLIIERAPGDFLPLTICRVDKDGNPKKEQFPSMVFENGETLLLTISNQSLPSEMKGGSLVLKLKPTGKGDVVWSETHSLSANSVKENSSVNVSVPIHGIEGAFDLILEVTGPDSGKGKFFLPQYSFSGNGKDSGNGNLRRVIQGIVLPPPRPTRVDDGTAVFEPVDIRDSHIETIDPTNPSWWKIFARRSGVLNETSEKSDKIGKKEREKFDPGALTSDFLKMWEWGELQASVKSLAHLSEWGRLDAFWQRSLGSGHLAPFESNNQIESSFVQLKSSGDPADPSWESYTIPIKEPGKEHILEIEYLSDFPQKLGVSILEPSITGGLFPRSLDTGIIVGNEPLANQFSHRVLRYRTVFWPKTANPTILLINRDTANPAMYGRIRVYRAKDEIKTALVPANLSKRSMTAVMSRPTFCDQFSAEKAPSTAGVVGADDWRTFELGAVRLTNYLKACGWDSLLLSMTADGSGLYPSDFLKPNPVFDSGIFLTEGNDPVRKDVAEYLFRLFEREQIRLVPLMTFNAPLPHLESEIRLQKTAENGTPESFYLVGIKGDPISVRCGGRVSYPYNILNPSVQREIFRCIDEFAGRYADHPLFRELFLDISADTFVRLPDNIYSGLDDETILRFASETKLAERCPEKLKEMLHDFISAKDEKRFYRRASMIRDYLMEDWLRWRAVTVCRFYRNAARILNEHIPGAQLFLGSFRNEPAGQPSPIFSSDEELAALEYRSLLRRGIDIGYIRQSENVQLFRSQPVEIAWRSGGLAANTDSPASVHFYASENGKNGALFYRDVKPLNLPSFDRLSLYHPTVTKICTQFSYSGYQNRERWAKQLALSDTQMLMDGGEMIPMGEEESQGEWISTFRTLPAAPFETYSPHKETSPSEETESAASYESTNPVVLRYRLEEDGLWGYFVNNAPFHCGVTLTVNCSPRSETKIYAGSRELTEPERTNRGIRWDCSLDPYDLVAFKIADPKASINYVETETPEEICGENGLLLHEAEILADRLKTAAAGVEISLDNPGFEDRITEPVFDHSAGSGMAEKSDKAVLGLDIPKINLLRNPFGNEKQSSADPVFLDEDLFPSGWHKYGGTGFTAVPDRKRFAEGETSLHLASGEASGGVAGSTFRISKTGRLYVDVRFGLSSEIPEEIPLYVTLAGKVEGEQWLRRIYVGNEVRRMAEQKLEEENGEQNEGLVWVRDSILFDGIPTEETADFSVRFELLPHGEVWIDDIHLYKLAFDSEEQAAIARQVEEIEKNLEEGRVGELLNIVATSASAALAEEIPNDFPGLAKRIAMREEMRRAAETEGIDENTEAEESAEVKENEKGSFLKRILPWQRK